MPAISAVIFDLDGTLTRVANPWRYIHERLGVWENTACGHVDQWLAGRISYEEFCQLDASLWNGRSVDEIHALLDEIEINRHVSDVVHRLVDGCIASIIISLGFHYVAAKIQSQCAWEPLLIYANELTEGPEVRIHVSGDLVSPISKKALSGKAVQLVGSALAETLVVSDNESDLEQLCDCGYKLHVREENDLLRVRDFL